MDEDQPFAAIAMDAVTENFLAGKGTLTQGSIHDNRPLVPAFHIHQPNLDGQSA